MGEKLKIMSETLVRLEKELEEKNTALKWFVKK